MPNKDLRSFLEDPISRTIFLYIKKKESAHLNELARELKVGSRVSIFDRLIKMENAGILVSNMELTAYSEKHVRKWMRKYRLSESYKTGKPII